MLSARMPELPEVEVVRRGLAEHLTGRTVKSAAVLHPRATRDHKGDFAEDLLGHTFAEPQRRGKYLWVPFEGNARALFIHLGMSGQILLNPSTTKPQSPHVRAQCELDANLTLSFIDQRTFGKLAVVDMAEYSGRLLPQPVGHIAPDPFEELFDEEWASNKIKNKHTEIKRVVLDQTVVSGVGNIYADEALFRVGIRPRRSAHLLSKKKIRELLRAAREVMTEALEQGGTSFDALYVNVNGESGYFSRSLNVYGREGQPCNVCGTPVVRISFMNRSSHYCPHCQR